LYFGSTKIKKVAKRKGGRMFKKVIILASCIILFYGQVGLTEVSNDDLFDEIRALREQIKKQEQRIGELEKRLAKQEAMPKQIELSDMIIEDFDKYLDAHLLHREESCQLLGGLRMGAGATNGNDTITVIGMRGQVDF
jgi:cell division protein FtsB